MTANTENKLVISEETANYFGRDVVDFINRQNILRGPVLVASAADCNYGDMNFLTRLFRKAQLSEHFGKAGAASQVDDVCNMQRDISIEGNIAGYSETDTHTSYDRDENGQSILRERNQAAFAVAMSSGINPRDYYSKVLEIPADKMAKNLPGNEKDLRALILFHELEHHRDRHFEDRSVMNWHEMHADRGADKLYGQALKEGVVSDTRLPDLDRSSRAMMAMMFGGHQSHYLSYIPDALHQEGKSASLAIQDAMGARKAVVQQIGRDMLTPDDDRKAKMVAVSALAYEGKMSIPDHLSTLTGPEHESELRKVIDTLDIPREHRAEFDETKRRLLEETALQKGTAETKDGKNSHLIYETARKLYLRGDFEDSPLQQELVKTFIHGAETYAPEHFGADNRQTIPATQYRPAQPSSAPMHHAPGV